MSIGIGENNRPFNGSRGAKSDYFDEIMEAPVVDGSIFRDSAGIADYDNVVVKQTGEGLDVKMHCRGCSAEATVVIPWEEVYAVAYFPQTQMLPPSYAVSEANKALYPKQHCPSCRCLVAPMLQPAWCAKQVEDVIKRDPQVVAAIQASPLCRQVAARAAQVRAGG